MPKRVAKPTQYHSNLDILIEDWTTHLQAGNKAETTFANYLNGVKQFRAFAEAEGVHLLAADRRLLERWLAGLYATLAPATVKTRYIALRLFFDWLVREDEIDASPFGLPLQRRILPPEVPETAKDVVPVEKLGELFRLLDRERRWRDAAIISVLYDTGMRASELAGALTANYDKERKTILLPATKGKRPRLVAISPDAAQYLARHHRSKLRSEPEYLINGQQGQMTRWGIYQVCEKLFKEVGIVGTVIGAHDMRHTSATHLALDGASETMMMDVFGWRSATMARHYSEQARQAAALEAHRAKMPMSRMRAAAKAARKR